MLYENKIILYNTFTVPFEKCNCSFHFFSNEKQVKLICCIAFRSVSIFVASLNLLELT